MTNIDDFPKGLETIYSHAKNTKHKNPPVETWNPDYCGEIDIKILQMVSGYIWAQK